MSSRKPSRGTLKKGKSPQKTTHQKPPKSNPQKGKPQKSKPEKKKQPKQTSEEWFQQEMGTVAREDPKLVDSDEEEEVDIADMPFIPINNKRNKKEEEEEEEGPTVVYLGHLPVGFEEYQLADYFKQFGSVTRSFIARSKNTARVKGYGFIEFEHSETAQIAADVMNDYLMFKKRLICKLVPKAAAARIRWPEPKEEEIQERSLFVLQQRNAHWHNTLNGKVRPLERLVEREQRKRQKLKKAGIDYEFDGYSALVHQLEEARETQEQRGTKRSKEDDEETERQKEAQEWKQRKKTKVVEDRTTAQKKQLQTKELQAQKKRDLNGNAKETETDKPETETPKSKTNTPAKKSQPTPAKETTTKQPATTSKAISTKKTNTPATKDKTEKTTPPAKPAPTPKSTPAPASTTPKTATKKTPLPKKKKISG